MRKLAAQRQSEIMRVLRSSDAPLTAYQVLEKLRGREPSIAPPTVYRALSSLTEQGRAHRLESLKAFVPCRCDHEGRLPVLAICDDCGSVDEHDGGTLLSSLDAMIEASAFTPSRHILEIHGQCRDCAS